MAKPTPEDFEKVKKIIKLARGRLDGDTLIDLIKIAGSI